MPNGFTGDSVIGPTLSRSLAFVGIIARTERNERGIFTGHDSV